MRRGHPGIGGWRNENQRHFRPRTGGSPRFRPPRAYSFLDGPRFPPPGPRLHRGPSSFNTHSGNADEHAPSNHHERNSYRNPNHHQNPRFQDRNHEHRSRSSYSYINPSINQDNTQSNQYKNSSNFYEDVQVEQFHVNSLGDIDQRQHGKLSHSQDSYQGINPWANPTPNQRQYYDDRGSQKYYRHYDSEGQSTDGNRVPSLGYTGHRPPSSDYYGSTSSTTINNNDTSFSRSVDDTVDIVRKRLMNRNEPQQSQDVSVNENNSQQEVQESATQITQQEQPTKKRIQRQRQVKSNCDKMKSNIVHQLFKMDKDKMHKLMDDPGSSSKFEYAISSLITESQNSLNRHLRSVAEKSLIGTSSDFIHNDNNTIYEDTFMKQMQCLLDPQDTVLLEDIKPLVMAELSKVLQLDDYEPRYDIEDQGIHHPRDEHLIYPPYESFNYDEFPQDRFYDVDQRASSNYEDSARADVSENMNQNLNYEYSEQRIKSEVYQHPETLFERRSSKRSDLSQDRRQSVDSQRQRRSIDKPVEERFSVGEEAFPLFDTNAEQFSEEEDTFAELDRQYHVPVDHNFLDDVSARTTPNSTLPTESLNPSNIKKEIDTQLPSFAESPLVLFPFGSKGDTDDRQTNTGGIKQEVLRSPDFPKENSTPVNTVNMTYKDHVHIKQEHAAKSKDRERETESTSISKTSQANSRKRSIDQRPSHRKEKRKKLESTSSDFGKHGSTSVAPKHDTSSSSRARSYSIEKCDDASRAYYSIFTARDVISKEASKVKSPTCKAVETKHASTQVIKRVINKESQTTKPERKNIHNKVSQTERIKYSSKSVQTPAALLEKPKSTAKDAFERMKEIDMEIQVLLQEKFQLYNNLEARDSCPSNMNLGMTVLNVTPNDEDNEKETEDIDTANADSNTTPDSALTADAIADDFTSIPVEELEQIALESVEDVNFDEIKVDKRRARQKAMQQERMNSESPHSTSSRRNNKKTKTPNISLIEQIITDDRPLEDIISLDDLEVPSPKHKKKSHKSKPKKKSSKKSRAVKNVDVGTYDLKECSVILIQTDITKFIKTPTETQTPEVDKTIEIDSNDTPETLKESAEHLKEPFEPLKEVLECETSPLEKEKHSEPTEIIEESVVHDLQFDMLDVSEDIVIGESCEIKDKDSNEQSTISEDLILDNSQSSADDVFTVEPAQPENVCKTYDFSTDEELRRDSLTVTGNADAVLAIECIENNFVAACLDGNVYHFSGDGQLLNTMRGSNLAVTCLTIVKEKYGTTVYTGSLDSRIRYYDLETGLEKGPECNVLSPIQTMDRAWDTVFVGTRTGFVLQFECKNNMLIPVSTVKFSEQAILALRAMKEGPRKVLLVASRSENVTVKDAQTGLLLRTLVGPKMTVYTLLFEDGKVYCGTSSHQIHVFDYASGSHTGCHEGGKGAVCLRAEGGLVFAGCYDGCVYVFREADARPLAQLRGPSLMLLSLAVLGTKIIAGYKDRSLYIWKIPLSILQEMIL